MTANGIIGRCCCRSPSWALMASMSLAASVFAPITFALFIIALAWPHAAPPADNDAEIGCPAAVAALILAVFFLLAWLTTWAAGRVTRWNDCRCRTFPTAL